MASPFDRAAEWGVLRRAGVDRRDTPTCPFPQPDRVECALAFCAMVSLDLRFVGTYRSGPSELEPLGALGDPTRRLIFETLTRGPRSVGDLARELPVSRPAVSQHLRALKEAGLVVDRPVGTRRIYQVDPSGVEQLRAYLDRVWGDALAAFKLAVEAEPDGTDTQSQEDS